MLSVRFAHVLSTVFICCFLLSAQRAGAQIFNKTNNQNTIIDDQQIISDSAKGFAEKGLDYKVDIYYRNQKGQRQEIDTSLHDLHQLGLLDTWDVDLGNTGTAYQSLKANAALPATYTLLPADWKAYRFDPEQLHFYNTTKPFSEIRYVAGSSQEQILELFHTQNIKPLWNFSTQYRKINSLGFFKAQKANIDNYKLTSSYQSKNQQYTARGAFVYNKIQQDENLGIEADSFLSDANFSNRAIIPVVLNISSSATRSTLLNYRRDATLRFAHAYSLGKTTARFNEDSIKVSSFKPILTFGNEVYYTAQRYCFISNDPDTLLQNNYLNFPFSLSDTLSVRYDNNTVGTNFSAEGNVYLGERVFSVLGGLGFEYQKIGGFASEQSAFNNYIFGTLNNTKSKDSSWKIDAQVKLYYTGLARGNINLTGNLSKKLPNDLGEFGADLGLYRQNPFYISESIQVNKDEVNMNLIAQTNTVLGGFYKNEKLRFRVSFHSLLFTNFIFSQGLQPHYQNDTNLISVQQLQAEKEFRFGHWTSENTVLLQLTPIGTPIKLPFLSSRHRIAYNDYLFEGKLQVSMGMDFYYNTPYFNDLYQPVFQSFNPQDDIKKQFVPRLNPFFNFKIKRFRASLSLDQVQHFLIKNNLNYQNYAAQNQMFRFGLRWIFIN